MMLLALAVSACGGSGAGGGSSAGEEAAADARAKEAKATAAAARAKEAKASAMAAQTKCKSQLGKFQAELDELDSRLNIGMANDEYGQRLGDIQVAYDAVDIPALKGECLSTAVIFEDGFNKYIKAGTKWDSCIENYNCDEPQVQPLWSQASLLLNEAEADLESTKTFTVQGVDSL